MKLKQILLIVLMMLVPLSMSAQKYKRKGHAKTTIKTRQKSKTNSRKSHLPTVNLAAELQKLSQNMVKIEGGKFMMGATQEQEGEAEANESPAHRVKLNTFYMCKYEVTQALWTGVMKQQPAYFKGLDLPIESVSWDDCQKFIKRLNQLTGKHYRMPTEAEWEYASRGGKLSKKQTFSGSNNLLDVAWFDENSADSTHIVGSKQPNELGLYDLSGNVWEWCEDDFEPYTDDNIDLTKNKHNAPASDATNGANSGEFRSGKVIRGGSWNRDLSACRTTKRDNYGPEFSNFAIGLRLVATEM